MSRLWQTILDKFDDIGFASGCHQIPERCFLIYNYRFPICARCTGVAIGKIFSVLTLIIGIKVNIFISIFMVGIMGLDWFIQYINILESNNLRRLITGACAGYGIVQIYFFILVKIINIIK